MTRRNGELKIGDFARNDRGKSGPWKGSAVTAGRQRLADLLSGLVTADLS